MRKILYLIALVLSFAATQAHAIGQITNPPAGGQVSGIGVFAGYWCNATKLEAKVDSGPLVEIPYGQKRSEWAHLCSGDPNVGFGFLINYSLFGDGWHSVYLYADNVQVASQNFHVTTFGTSYLSGPETTYVMPDFPFVGHETRVQWQDINQNFIITQYDAGSTKPFNQVQTERLIGVWDFFYTIGSSPFEQTYTLNGPSIESTADPGEYFVLGTDTFGNADVIAGYDSQLGQFGLLDLGPLFDRFFIFDLLSNSSASGCYFQVQEGDLGNCYQMSGNKIGSNTLKVLRQYAIAADDFASELAFDYKHLEAADYSSYKALDLKNSRTSNGVLEEQYSRLKILLEYR